MKKYKVNIIRYGIPLIDHKHLMSNIRGLNMDYLDLFIVQTHMLKSHFKGHRTKIDNENIKYEVESDI